MSKEKIKVYQLNEADWWAGRSLDECIEDACVSMCICKEDLISDGVEHELTPEEMRIHKFCRDPDDEDESCITFAAQLKRMINDGETFPCFFASTEY